ncbi:hypothetical protein LCGC14_3094730, partial [marine sediment metagenome]
LRLYPAPCKPDYDFFNIAVWTMEEDGFLFVRSFSPRVDITFIDVFEGGKLTDVPEATDISPILDKID